jgi:uncharacterized SAM-binding protein YcdF (DUF218 family)
MTQLFLTFGRRKSLDRRRPLRRRLAMVTGMVVSVAMAVWVGREPLLRAVASVWIVSDPVTRADAIVVLGGNFQLRPLIAAEMYRRGVAGKILISQTAGTRRDPVVTPTDAELSRAALVKLNVPPSAVENFGTANINTRDEAVSLREWAERNAASQFIIPTELFNSRRVRWIFRRELWGSTVTITVPTFEPPEYTRDDWWKKEQGIAAFKNELIKYLYYRIKY